MARLQAPGRVKNGNGNGHDEKGRVIGGNAGGGRPRKKSRAKSPALFQLGGPQGPGRGPEKGQGGRPPDELKRFLGAIRDDPVFRARIEALAYYDPDPSRFMRFAEWLVDRTEGKAPQILEHTGAEGEEIAFRVKIDGAVDPL